ncbi:hypothetical protein [Pseudonocardia sp. ICBG1293]|uniref:hypothetical protein n=1 Tax=Pseudonocardia sp. ICBG1293 TaxID=2844382 RepID=UPI001CCA2CD0|nr:hypothetical protein [Pseudonocardia sp. ICBG1293]
MPHTLRSVLAGTVLAVGASVALAAPALAAGLGPYNSKNECIQAGIDYVNVASGGYSSYECIGNGNPNTDSTQWTLYLY